jgi:hypothetical protein
MLTPAVSLWTLDGGLDAEDRKRAERNVDEKYPAPVVKLGQVRTEARTQNRPEHHAHAEHRHRRTLAMDGVGIEHRRLCDRHERSAEAALQEAEQHHLFDRRRKAAHHRCDDESGDGDQIKIFTAPSVGEESRRRGHDGRRHDIRRQHPRSLILRRRKRTLHIRQCDGGNCRVERLQDCRQHDGRRDDGAHPGRFRLIHIDSGE